MATLCTFIDFTYFSSYLQTKENAWKRRDAIFSEPGMLWSSLGLFGDIQLLRYHKMPKILPPLPLLFTLVQFW